MNARADDVTGSALPLAALLGPGAAPDFVHWDHARAARHRALLARDAAGAAWLLVQRTPEPLLVQALESRVRAPLRVRLVDAATLQAWLDEGEHSFRALDGVGEHDASAAAARAADELPVHELSSQRIAEQLSPAVRLLDAVLHDALRDGASDIHVECDARGAQLRLRLDGVMLDLRRIDGVALAEQIVSRLKVMAELDIGERRLPQDGRFKLRVAAREVREIDFRLSIMPSLFGEDAVVRVLDRATLDDGAGHLTLRALGFDAPMRSAIESLARRPHGMLLVTGPTGSGKTTTLYAAITETHSSHDKVITIEDPVEYRLPGVVQIPVNEKKGLGFARGLRSILRHDPDRVLVGEIRDPETAQIAVQAALTGHLVFSTVHANNALDVIGRFMHMGLDLYNTVAALNAVLAQRLLRVLCEHCALPADTRSKGSGTPRRAVGCPHCRGTGYRGRRAVAELLRLDDSLRDAIAARAPMSQLKQLAAERGLRPLRAAAQDAVQAGWTTPEEVERVTADA
jgi:general secretion pathway protein E